MIRLDSITKILQLVCTGNCSVVASCMVDAATGYTGMSEETVNVAGGGTYTIGAAPALSTTVKHYDHVAVTDTSGMANTFTPQIYNSVGPVTIPEVKGAVIPAYGTLEFTHAYGWKVVSTSSLGTPVYGEAAGGVMNGINATFTLAHAPLSGALRLYHNGQRMTYTTSYTLAGLTITVLAPQIPISGDDLIADYNY